MLNKKNLIAFAVVINIIIAVFLSVNVWAQTEDPPAGDEDGTFISVAPDALIIMDLSGSMLFNPTGDDVRTYGQSSCAPDPVHCVTGASENCSGGYCEHTRSGCSTDCRRLAIAKRALFNILDDDNNNSIDNQDALSLQVRIGYMRFYNGDDTAGNYATGNNKLITKISELGKDTGTSYQLTYCGKTGTTSSCSSTDTCTSNCIAATTSPSGGTPLASSLREAKTYLDAHKASDKAKDCRQKFVILVTDGADTYACSGGGGECDAHMYKRRREVVAAAKQLSDAGYKVFVVGFGDMPAYLQNTLNWMAYYGGSDNPLAANSGSTTAYNIPIGCNANPAVPSACCNLSTNPTACYPSGVTSCQTDSSFIDDTTYCGTLVPLDPDHNFRAANNDPGYTNLSGYAFLAGDADQLTTALKSAFGTIRDATYSFTQPSIQAVRTIDENFVYEASFQPVTYDPFWIGHLKRYTIQENGTVNNTADWDAGEVLAGTSAGSRSIWTYAHGSFQQFTSGNLIPADLGVTTDADKDAIINYIRGGESNGTVSNWKLGDIFHTSPMSIASPNALFYDRYDKSDPKAFANFRDNHIRTSANGKRIILIGANDGQLHAFKTGQAGAGGGQELWSFIPPNFLPKLQSISHSTHPTNQDHQYFVDGPLSAADIWLGSGTPFDSTDKSASQWHTYLIMSEGRGGRTTLWSSHTSCAENFSSTYSATYANYCGYYAFDVSDTTTTPIFKWRLGNNNALSATDGAHLGQAWSKMYMGRVRINNTEKWVGLIGGGYSGTDCKTGGTCDTRGKGFYVVDLSNGSILWRYTHSGPDGQANGNMDYNLVAGPVAIDSDSDGFLDTAYIGDLGGNVWRFKFCQKSDDASCGPSSWTGGLLFQTASGNIRPIYNPVAVSVDNKYQLWVYFGTGDKTDPTAPNAQEKIYAVKDSDRSATYSLNDLDNITTGTYADGPTKHGWYINFTGGGEKMLSEPVIFDGRAYFTTYVPASGSNPCDQGGDAKLYIVDYITGVGKLGEGGARSEIIGSGIPSAPVISRNPYGGTDVYVSTSEATAGSHTAKKNDPNQNNDPPNRLIFWHDLRVQ